MKDSKKIFSQQLQLLRVSKGITQEQLGEAVGVTQKHISYWETGNTIPNVNNLVLLADYFNVSLDIFMKREIVDPKKDSFWLAPYLKELSELSPKDQKVVIAVIKALSEKE
jgi:transcriptional regulator with XRE-family HTH domain